MDAKNIQIFLPDGNPRGIKVAELSSRTVKAIMIPRPLLSKAGERSELSGVGLYFLFADEKLQPPCYIGETEDCFSRLKQHNIEKEWWTHAVAFVSTNQHFTKSHVRYLEWKSYQQAQQVGRYTLKNGNIPSQPHIHETVLADIDDIFSTISLLISLMGYPLFSGLRAHSQQQDVEALKIPTSNSPDILDNTIFLTIKGLGLEAKGSYSEEGVVIFQGSQTAYAVRNSAQNWVVSTRKELLDNGILQDKGNHLEFTSDYLCNSPSTASAIIRGGAANGWLEWKYANGLTLDEVHRQNVLQSK